jgi:WD40 repeat protein
MNDGPATKVFVSYSRSDDDFCRHLTSELSKAGYEPIFDKSPRAHEDPDARLTAQDEWWKQLQIMIAACDVMVFAVSSASAASRVCDDEIARARDLGKRVIGILVRTVDFDAAPERLRAMNISIDFRDLQHFSDAFGKLCRELDEDIEWHRRGTRLTRLAHHWNADSRPDSQLLRSGAVDEFDNWAIKRPRNAPEPGPLVLEFLDRSRKKERADSDERRRITGRAFVKPSLEQGSVGNYGGAVRQAAAGMLLSDDPGASVVPQLNSVFRQAAYHDRTRLAVYGPAGASFSPNGASIVVVRHEGDFVVRIHDAADGRETVRLVGHRDWVRTAYFNGDGTRIVTASADGTARLWDAVNGRQLACYEGDGGRVYSARLSQDELRVLTASGDGTASLWDTATGREIARTGGHSMEVTGAEFYLDDTRIVTTSEDHTARIWNGKDCSLVAVLLGHEAETIVGVSADGTRLVTAGKDHPYDRRLLVWHGRSGKLLESFDNPIGQVSSVAISADGTRIAAGVADGALVWDVAGSKKRLHLKGHTDQVTQIRFTSDGSKIITASGDGTASLWDAATGSLQAALRGHEDAIVTLELARDDRRIATGSRDQTVRVWDIFTDELAAAFQGEDESNTKSIGFANDDRLVFAAGMKAQLWDPGMKLPVGRLAIEKAVVTAALSPGRTRLATFLTDHQAVIWDIGGDGSATRLAQIEGSPALRPGKDASMFDADGNRCVLAASEHTARIWACDGGQEIASLRGHSERVTTAVFSPDGNHVVTSGDHTARIWEATTGRIEGVVRESSVVYDAAFSPDGHRLIVSSLGGSSLWHIDGRPQLIGRLPAGNPRRRAVTAFSADGRRIVSASDGIGLVWDAGIARPLAQLQGIVGTGGLAFSRDRGRIVGTTRGSGGAGAAIWDAHTGALIAELPVRGVNDVALSSDGKVLAVAADDSIVRIFDVERTSALAGSSAVVVAASLASGRGQRSRSEREDLLMQAAPDDLFAAIYDHLSDEEREDVRAKAMALAQSRDARCYLSSGARPKLVAKNVTDIEQADAMLAEWKKKNGGQSHNRRDGFWARIFGRKRRQEITTPSVFVIDNVDEMLERLERTDTVSTAPVQVISFKQTKVDP